MIQAPKLAIAINYIDDDLIEEAVNYIPSQSRRKSHLYIRFLSTAACLLFAFLVFFAIKSNHQRVDDPLSGKFIGKIIEITDTTQCLAEITVADHNLAEGSNVYIQYEIIIYNSVPYNNPLKKDDSIVVVYDSTQIKDTNDKKIITVPSIEIIDSILPYN